MKNIKSFISLMIRTTRPNEAKFHLNRAWEIVEKMMRINTGEKINGKEQNMEIFEKTMFC